MDSQQELLTFASQQLEARNYAKAREACKILLRGNAKLAQAHLFLGKAHRGLRSNAEAIASFRKAITSDPALVEARIEMGVTLAENGQEDIAAKEFSAAIDISPQHADPYFQLGKLFHGRHFFEEAVHAFRQALHLRPSHAESHVCLGMAYLMLGRFDEAKARITSALEISPSLPSAHDARGLLAEAEGDEKLALAHFGASLKFDPGYASAQFNRGVTMFKSGNFKEGWVDFEARWRTKPLANYMKTRRNSQHLWLGEPLANKKLLIWGEQGIGDEIRCAKLIRKVLPLAKQVAVECDRRLIGLFRRSFPEIEFHGRAGNDGRQPSAAKFDYHIPADSLLSKTSLSLDELSSAEDFLIVDSRRTERFRELLSKESLVRFGRKVPIIGISWASTNLQFQVGKSTRLELWKSIIDQKCLPVDLQYGDTFLERQQLGADGHKILHVNELDLTSDIDGAASLIKACDLVITVSNTTAHISAATGTQTWVLVPFGHFQPWYWFRETENSYWYRSVKIYRLHKFGAWGELLQRVGKDLASWINKAVA